MPSGARRLGGTAKRSPPPPAARRPVTGAWRCWRRPWPPPPRASSRTRRTAPVRAERVRRGGDAAVDAGDGSRIDANIEDAKQEAGADVTVATEALRAELEAQTRGLPQVRGALEETAEQVGRRVGGEIADAVGAVAEELRRSVLELAGPTTESETLRAPAGAERWRRRTRTLGLNAEALGLRGDVAAAVEKAEGMEAAAGAGGGRTQVRALRHLRGEARRDAAN